jgi:hypothetical protein
MNELLKALADADREREAPAVVEMRLRAAFRKKHQRRVWPYFAAVAAAIAAVIVLSIIKTKPPLKPQAIETREVAPIVQPLPVVARNEAPAPRRVFHRRPPLPKEEIVTEFYPLMEDPLPFERGELLRVSLPAAAMRTVGVTVSEDRLGEIVQADVLVGQEGLARAIRFVNARVNQP